MPDLQEDLDYIRAAPSWQQADEPTRRELIRKIAAQSAQEDPPEYHQQLTSALWQEADPDGMFTNAAQWTGNAVKEVALSIPAAGVAAGMAATDAVGLSDTGSGTRLGRGVAELWDTAGQRIKQLMPGDKQEELAAALADLQADIHDNSVPQGFKSFLAGEEPEDDEGRQFVDLVGRGLARLAVQADHSDATPEQEAAYLASDRSLFSPQAREHLADYMVTRDPGSWAAFTERVTETDAQYTTRIERQQAEQGIRRDLEDSPEWVQSMAERGMDMQTSPIDMASAVLPVLRGMKLFKAVQKGKRAASGGLAVDSLKEGGQEALTSYLEDARNTAGQIAEAGAMGVVGNAAVQAPFAIAGKLTQQPTPETPVAEPGVDDVSNLLDAVGDRQAAAYARTEYPAGEMVETLDPGRGPIVVETGTPPAQTAPAMQAPTVLPPQQVPLGSPESADMLPSVPTSESAPTPGADPRLQPATEGLPATSSPPIASPAMPQSGPAASATALTTSNVPPPTQQAPGQLSQETAESRPRVRMSHPSRVPEQMESQGDGADPTVRADLRALLTATALPKPTVKAPSLQTAWKAFKGLVGQVINTPVGINVRIKPGHFGALTAESTGERQKGRVGAFESAEAFRQAMDRGEVQEMPGYDSARAEHLENVPQILSSPDIVLRPKEAPHKLIFVSGQKAGALDSRLIFTVYDKSTDELGLLSHHPRDLSDGFLAKHDIVYRRNGTTTRNGVSGSGQMQNTGPSPTAPSTGGNIKASKATVKGNKVTAANARDGIKLLKFTAPDLAAGVQVVNSRADLNEADYHPEDWADLDTTEAFFNPRTGDVVILTDNVQRRPGESGVRAVVRAIAHEQIGHAGLAALRQQQDGSFARRWGKLVDGLFAIPATAAEINAIAQEPGYAHLAGDRSALAEEWFARKVEALSDKDLQALTPTSPLGKLWQWVKDALRGLSARLERKDWTTQEVREIMALSKQALKDRPAASEGRVAMSQPQRPQPTLGPDQDTRTFGGRVRDDPRISSGTQTTMGMDAVYDIARNADTFAAANALIDQQGLAAAEQILYDESNGLPGHVRVTLGQQLIMRMDKAARTNPDVTQRKALRDAAAKVLDYTDRKGTEAGQTVQAFAMWARMSPEGVMMHYDRKLKEANGGKLPTLPPELLDKLGELRDQINALPGDSITRAEKMHELLTELARFDGVPIGSLFASIWYANLLSGLTTQGINVWGNGLHLAMRNMAAAFVSHPADTARMLGATMRGLAKGYADAKAALRGKHIMKGSVKYDTPSTSDYARNNAMEIVLGKPPSDLKSWAAWIGSVGGLTKYVFRSLQAADAIFWHTAAEGRASLAASRAARANHKPGSPAYFQYISDALGTSQAAFVGALDQAANEMKAAGMPVDLNLQNRRAWELLERSRPQEVNEEAHRFADMATFNEDPRGVGKWIYDVIQSLQGVQVAGVQPLRALLPFARIPANLVSLGLDFTPVGALRAAVGHHITDKKAEPFSTPERLEKLAASVMGTIAGAIVYQVASQFAGEDDESAPFMLYGSGRGSKEKNATMPPGWKPFSIKVGDKYISYAETPMGLMLAPLGALMDSNRYKTGLNEQSWAMRADYLFRTMAGTVFSQGVLSSAADVMDVMGGKTPLAKLPSRFTSGMIPMSGMMRDITPLFDPVKISDDTVMAAILRDVPVVRNLYGRPALNIFGEPVQAEGLARVPVIKRMITSQGDHPQANWMARKNLSVSGFEPRLEFGAYLPAPQRRTMQENRAARAATMSRLSSNIMTPEENYTFTKRAGELTKQAVIRLMALPQSTPADQLQDRLDDAVRASRKLAMRELASEVR